jgi:peptidoglycan/xylan/chitin deacetylase (PgdA/CDA1 family)
LARYNARATFFVLGRSAEAHPALVNAISAAGHTLANHTYSHPALAGIGREAFMREVAGAQAILGGAASRCFRPPYGSLDASTYAYAAELGLRVVLWDVDPQDWALPGAGAIAARVLAATGPGSIVLFHDGGGERSQTVAALASVLAEFSAQGYRFEALQC